MCPPATQPFTESDESPTVGTNLSPPSNPWKYEDPADIMAEARSWAGTPHRNRMAVKKVGVDCLHFVGALLKVAKILPEFRMPYYDPNWGIGRRVNVMEPILVKTCHVDRIPPGQPWEFGDVVIFSVGRQSNHCGIFLDGSIWHVMTGRTVEPLDPTPEVLEKLQCVLRFTAAGFHRRPETLTLEDMKP